MKLTINDDTPPPTVGLFPHSMSPGCLYVGSFADGTRTLILRPFWGSDEDDVIHLPAGRSIEERMLSCRKDKEVTHRVWGKLVAVELVMACEVTL